MARIEPGASDFKIDIDTTTLILVVLNSRLSNAHLEKGGEETKESEEVQRKGKKKACYEDRTRMV